jgi:hypothetical protein
MISYQEINRGDFIKPPQICLIGMTIIAALPEYRFYAIGHLDFQCNGWIGNGWPYDLYQTEQDSQKDQYEDKFSQDRWRFFCENAIIR